MISTEVFFPADEESLRYGSSASGSPSTSWPTGSCTAVGRAVGGRSPAGAGSRAPDHAEDMWADDTSVDDTTPGGNSRGLEAPPTRRSHRRASREADRGQDRDRSTGRAQRRRDRAVRGPRAAGLAVYADPADPESTAGNATIAEATTIAVRRLVGQ
ncbi:hypothetical protein GCM10009579_58970 [Streptomyces javensis]|uniref:Uncharacterized protein n=1 Tax=Streptomyces javensis TaxID=114698 RepID=A0ABN1X8K5_9ACTN